MNLNAGETVTIKVKNPIWPMRKAYASYVDIPEYNTYTGTVIRNHKAIRPDQIGLTTGNKSFDMRVIDINRIAGFEDSPEAAKAKAEYKTYVVKGSKNAEYIVTQDHNQLTCTCPGFGFRRACKHVDEIKSKL